MKQSSALEYKNREIGKGKKMSIVGSFAEFGTPKWFVELTEQLTQNKNMSRRNLDAKYLCQMKIITSLIEQ